MKRGVVALKAFLTPAELQKWSELHHGREMKVHADRERAKNMVRIMCK